MKPSHRLQKDLNRLTISTPTPIFKRFPTIIGMDSSSFFEYPTREPSQTQKGIIVEPPDSHHPNNPQHNFLKYTTTTLPRRLAPAAPNMPRTSPFVYPPQMPKCTPIEGPMALASWCMDKEVYMEMYVYMEICTFACMYMYVFRYVYVYVYVYMCICIYIYMYIHIYMCAYRKNSCQYHSEGYLRYVML